MPNTIQTIVHEFVQTYPGTGQPAKLSLVVGTHDPERDTSKFRMSDAGKCRLMRYFKREGREGRQNISADVRLQMQAGNLVHAYIEEAIGLMRCLVASEQPLEDEHRIGHFDMIVCPPDDDVRILYDIKTITNKKAYYMEREGWNPDPQHVAQLVSYALLYDGALSGLCLAYIVRDTMDIHEVSVNIMEHSAGVIADWDILIKAWHMQQPPDPNPNSWECRYCAYQSLCGK